MAVAEKNDKKVAKFYHHHRQHQGGHR